MSHLDCTNVSFTYSGAKAPALQNLTFSIKPGEFVLLCGPSGCGKTTLFRLIKRELQPAGYLKGKLRYNGVLLDHLPEEQAAGEIGMVFQHPEHQIVMEDTLHELVFGMENLGFSSNLMRRRAAETTAYLGLEKLLYRPTHTLSGGQKQLLNLASVLALRPRLLLLDEPTAHLDPVGAVRFLHTVKRINEETGITVILTEHRLEEVYPLADRVMVMEKGNLSFNGSPREGIKWMNKVSSLQDLIPGIPSFILQTGETANPLPLNVKEGREWVKGKGIRQSDSFIKEEIATPSLSSSRSQLSLHRIDFRYESEEDVLKQTSFAVNSGECVAVFGGNGSGKSTLLQVMAGLLQPYGGTVRYQGKKLTKRIFRDRKRRIGYLPQNPEAFFLHETVEAELKAAAAHYSREERQEQCQEMISRFQLAPYLSRHPHDLSGGEMQKVALASLFLRDPEVLLLDEPTTGIDPIFKRIFSLLLKRFVKKGRSVVLTTHDVEFAAITATRCALLFDREILASGAVSSFLRDNDYYTTAIYRMTRDTGIPEAVTVEEAVQLWQGQQQLSVLS